MSYRDTPILQFAHEGEECRFAPFVNEVEQGGLWEKRGALIEEALQHLFRHPVEGPEHPVRHQRHRRSLTQSEGLHQVILGLGRQ